MAFDAVSALNPDDLLALGRQVESALASQPEIATALSPYGYDAAAATALAADLDALEAAITAQRDQYGQQYTATEDTAAARDAFRRDTYAPHAALARVEFRDEGGTLARLGLNGGRKQDFHGWAAQAHQFYTTLSADAALQARMTTRGLPAPDATAALAALDALQATERSQEDRKGLAQQATRDRDAQAQAFATWLRDFRDTARVALSAHPDWLERLGFLARSEDS